MKFLKLRLTNINSYYESHEIDFRNLNKQGIFIISGPTGSGKSTILNSISLALYGKVYKNDLNHSDFITQGQPSGAIDLIFQLGAKKYRAVWECKVQKKDGEPLKRPQSKRHFYTWDKIQSDWEINESPIEEITHLDHDQFIKTVILNQGEFSRFLTSSFAERRAILEGLSNESFLRFLSPKLTTDLKELNKVCDDLNTNIEILEEEIENGNDIEVELNAITKTLEVKEKLLIKLQNIKDKVKDLNQSIKEYQRQNSHIIELNTKYENSLNEKLIITKELNEKRKDLNDLKFEYENIRPKLRKAIELQIKIDNLKDITEKQSRDLKKNSESFFNTQKESEEINYQLNNIEKDLQLKKPKLSWEELQKQKVSIEKSYINLVSQKEKYENLILKSRDSLSTLISKKQVLNKIEINKAEYDAISIQETGLRSRLEQSKKQLEVLTPLQSELLVYENDIAKKQSNLSNLEVDLPNYSIEQLQEVLKNSENIGEFVSKLPKSVIDYISSNRIYIDTKEEINSLKEKQSSKLEPYKNIKTLNELTSIIEKLKLDIESYSINLDEQKKKKEELKIQQQSYLDDYNLFQRHKESLINNLNLIPESFSIDNAKSEMKKVENQLKEIQADLELVSAEKDQINKEFNLEREYQNLVANRSKLNERKKANQNKLEELNKSRIILKRDFNQNNETLIKYLKEINQFGFQDNPNDIEESFQEKFNKLQLVIDSQSESQKNCENELNRIFGQIENLKSSTEMLRVKCIKFIEALGKLDKSFDPKYDIDEVLRNDFFIYESYYKDILSGIDNTTNDLKNLSEDLGKFQNQKQLIASKVEQLKELKKELKQKLAHKEQLDLLYLIIGKDEFRNYVLKNLEELLIHFANLELKNLYHSRFELVHGGKKDKDFYIIDHFNLGEKRKISTLSGGEVFIVSLCLALGLSEATAGNSEISSFFIDEGFGTLDKESLGEVVESLYSLKERGKIIGLISHVEEMKTGIPSKILLDKDLYGRSQINVLI